MKKKITRVEVVDKNNVPISVMDLREVHRQSLLHRSVVILVYNGDGKLFLQKRSSGKKHFAGRWDISAGGHVLSGESNEASAIRKLNSTLGIKTSNIRLLSEIKASSETGNEFLSVFIYDKANTIRNFNTEKIDSGYFYSQSELDWLIKEYRELLAPTIVFLHDKNILFTSK